MKEDCRHCDGKGKQIIPLVRSFNWVDKEGTHTKWADIIECKWCLGTGKHTPLNEQEYI